MRRLLIAVLSLAAQPVLAFAQSGTAIGSTTAAFGTGVSLARDADAVFWNPALLGIQPFGDVRAAPSDGLRLLSLSIGAAPSREWIADAGRLGFFDRGSRTAPAWARGVARSSAGVAGGTADLVWVSSATGSLGISVSSHVVASGEVRDPVVGDSVHRAAYSTVMLGLAGPSGTLLGMRARTGLTVKGRLVHVHGAAAWLDSMQTGALLRETVLRNVPGVSADIGVVLQPGPLVVSAVLSDAVRATYRPAHGARTRTVVRVDGDLEEQQREIDASDSAAVRAAAEELYAATVPPAVARVGVSWAGRYGEPSLSLERRLSDGGLASRPESAWAVSYRFAGFASALRVSVAGGSGSSGVQLGWIARGCRVPWALGVGRWRPTRDAVASFAMSLSFGARADRACGVRS